MTHRPLPVCSWWRVRWAAGAAALRPPCVRSRDLAGVHLVYGPVWGPTQVALFAALVHELVVAEAVAAAGEPLRVPFVSPPDVAVQIGVSVDTLSVAVRRLEGFSPVRAECREPGVLDLVVPEVLPVGRSSAAEARLVHQRERARAQWAELVARERVGSVA